MEALTLEQLDELERKILDWQPPSYAKLHSLLAMARSSLADRWVPVSERLPESGAVVLACYLNGHDKLRCIRANWITAKTWESGSESEIGEYDEATDTYYDPEGWYERIDNWPDYTAVAVCEGTITHWMPLPQPPKD